MKAIELQKILDGLTNKEQAKLLLIIGHQMTVMARYAYEFQGPGVTNPRLLRDINEINHRLFPQIKSLLEEKPEFPNEVIASWVTGEEKPELQKVCLYAIQRAMEIKST